MISFKGTVKLFFVEGHLEDVRIATTIEPLVMTADNAMVEGHLEDVRIATHIRPR